MRIDRQAIWDIVGDESRFIFDSIPPEYLTDALGRLCGAAEALVFPLSAQEVSGILRYAHEHRVPVTPRGAGTNLVGSTVPLQGGIILDFSRMNRVLELDRDTLTVTVEPGILLQNLQAYVESQGFFYPPDPGEKASSLGGNISTNAGGMRAVKYGVTRDYVRGLEAVLADGTILTVGGKQVKDASGLSLKHLLVGSEGTLAVITKCVLRLVPKPEASVSVLVPYRDLETGIRSVLAILRADANPTAVEFMERKVVALGEKFSGVEYPCPEAGSYILLTFDGHKAEVEANLERVRDLVLKNGALDCILLEDPARAADIWKVRGALVKAVEAVSEQEPVDIVVPISRTADFIAFINGLEASSGVQMVSFGHAGDGNVHLCVVRGDRDGPTWERELHAVMDRAYHEAYRLGGVASGEHGIGVSKRRYFLRESGRENLAIMNRIKDALDPLHILNDHKSYIGGYDHAEPV
ncbi:FAD-binding oxidoreductase [uncultured Oscillibacter sp.]|jgi:glycolate oxidase|uniref:FAD-binding oxidoreductase n=1 Tax=uncultured Oscillibacter sp. TaxID=876091 RepID=UPI0026311D7D|nr:FAD-binding oxidoreductase [uncultured Oscillibacter sp.]